MLFMLLKIICNYLTKLRLKPTSHWDTDKHGLRARLCSCPCLAVFFRVQNLVLLVKNFDLQRFSHPCEGYKSRSKWSKSRKKNPGFLFRSNSSVIDGSIIFPAPDNTLIWGPYDLAPGAQHRFTFSATVTEGSPYNVITNTVTFDADNHPPGQSNSATFILDVTYTFYLPLIMRGE